VNMTRGITLFFCILLLLCLWWNEMMFYYRSKGEIEKVYPPKYTWWLFLLCVYICWDLSLFDDSPCYLLIFCKFCDMRWYVYSCVDICSYLFWLVISLACVGIYNDLMILYVSFCYLFAFLGIC
jgi:hypothetical protein